MSKGGGSTQTAQTVTANQIPKWMEDAAKQNLERANYVSQLGYVPNYGMDVAAFSPLQQQAMQASGMAGQAFGLAPQGFDATAGIPTPTTDSFGFTGYSSGNMFDNALTEFSQRRPGQYNAMQSMFVNPESGEVGTLFTPTGSLNTQETSNPLATYQIRDFVDSDGGVVNTTPTKSEWETLMSANNFVQGVKDYPLMAPGGLLVKLGSALAQNTIIDPYEAERQLKLQQYANGGRSSTGDSGYVSGNYGGHTISYGTADSQGRNSAGHTAGGTGRTDGGYGW